MAWPVEVTSRTLRIPRLGRNSRGRAVPEEIFFTHRLDRIYVPVPRPGRLCTSAIVPMEDLTALSGTGYRFIDVRNEVGRKDIVVWSAWAMSWLIRGLGVAGLRGFKGEESFIHTLSTPGLSCPLGNSCSAKIHNMFSEYLGHSDAFVGSGYAEAFWLPYLWGIEPEEYQQFRLSCKLAAGLERPWSAGARAQGHVDPRLIAVENKLLGSSWRWCNGSFAQYVRQEVASKKNVTGQELDQLTALAARGVWQVIHLAAQARLNRQERLSVQLATRQTTLAQKIGFDWRRHRVFSNAELVYDPTIDQIMEYLDPRSAVRCQSKGFPRFRWKRLQKADSRKRFAVSLQTAAIKKLGGS